MSVPSGVTSGLAAGPRRTSRDAGALSQSLAPTPIALMSFLCGCALHVRLDVVGELFLAEVLLAPMVLMLILAKGIGRAFSRENFNWFLAAGLVTFIGYVLSDIISSNDPTQYLKGWGRVIALVLDGAGLTLLASHGRRNLWWFMLGVGIGGVVMLAMDRVPLTVWKGWRGYGDYAALVVVTLASLLSAGLAALLVGVFGVVSMLLDYRSMGAAALVAAGLILIAATRGRRERAGGMRLLMIGLVAGFVSMVLLATLSSNQEDFNQRRKLSNLGRTVGISVAWQAISESPLIGYGSWASDARFARLLREEARRQQQNFKEPVDFGRSLLPHSQVLQAWVEGGILGTAYFLVYAVTLLLALRWLAWEKVLDRFGPPSIFIMVLGLWHLAASPFLGINRIYLALAVGAIAVARFEAERSRRAVSRSATSRRPAPQKWVSQRST